MILITNWCRLTAIAATPGNAPSEPSKNTLWQGSPQLTPLFHCTYFRGLVDYNKTAFALPGCKIIAHEKPGKRRTWDTHGQHGYLLGPAMHHYR
jgi:hypothetical protein